MKKCLVMLLAIMMIFTLAACGDDTESTPETSAKQEVQAETSAETAQSEATEAATTAAETTAAETTTVEETTVEETEAEVVIEGSSWHAFVNVGDYMTIRTGVKENEKENDPLRYLDYDGICLEYDFVFGEDGILTITLCENQDAFNDALYEKMKQALILYYEGVIAAKGLTVSAEKYMEMENVDVDHYVKVGSSFGDIYKDTGVGMNMFPKSDIYYAVDAGSNAIYWSRTYSDGRLFDAGVKWTYTTDGGKLTITGQTGEGGSGLDEWAGFGINSKITPDEATIYPIELIKK